MSKEAEYFQFLLSTDIMRFLEIMEIFYGHNGNEKFPKEFLVFEAMLAMAED